MWKFVVLAMLAALYAWNDGIILERSENFEARLGAGRSATADAVVQAEPLEQKQVLAAAEIAQIAPRAQDAAITVRDDASQTLTSLKAAELKAADDPPPPFVSETVPLAQVVQQQLKRIGCYPHRVDNVWGKRSREAMQRFNRLAGRNLNVAEPDPDALKVLKAYGTNFCQSVCGETSGRKRVEDCETVVSPAPKPRYAAQPAVQETAPVAAEKPKAPDYDGDDAYLPPWMRGKAAEEARAAAATAAVSPKSTDAVADAPAASLRIDDQKLSTKNAEQSRSAAKRPREWKSQRFDFAWPGQY